MKRKNFLTEVAKLERDYDQGLITYAEHLVGLTNTTEEAFKYELKKAKATVKTLEENK